jgi:acylphosphatase
MPESKKHYVILLKGRVQGVGYRAFARETAHRYQVTGYVKNKPDGSVLVEAEGSPDMLDLFVQACKKGPGWANVNDINVSSSPVQGYSDFRIKY